MKIHMPVDGTEESGKTLCGRLWPEGAIHRGGITCLTCLRKANANITTERVYTKEQLFEVLTYYINGFSMANASSAKVPLANVKRWERCREEIAVQSEALNKIIKEIKRRMP